MKTFLWGALSGALLISIIAGFVVVKNNAAAKQRVLTANVAAEHFQLAYVETAKAFEERAFVITSQKDMLKQLEADNEGLSRLVRDRDARILSLVSTQANLEARLDSSATQVAQTDSTTYRVDLDESVVLDGGGYIRVLGTVDITVERPPSVEADLGVLGSFPLSIVITEQPDGQLAVFAYTGDDRLRIGGLDVRIVPAATGQSGLFDAIGRALSSPAPWIGAGVGFLGCLAFMGAF